LPLLAAPLRLWLRQSTLARSITVDTRRGGKPVACQLPGWVQYLQALSTPALALLALAVAVGQWRLAHQRIVLDLFDRRMAKYEALRGAVAQVVTSGSARNEDSLAFARAANDVEFMFGPEVKAYVDSIHNAMIKHHALEMTWEKEVGEQREKAYDRMSKHFETIAGFYDEFPKKLKDYVRVDQKAFWF
jgi:hypothetical protein